MNNSKYTSTQLLLGTIMLLSLFCKYISLIVLLFSFGSSSQTFLTVLFIASSIGAEMLQLILQSTKKNTL